MWLMEVERNRSYVEKANKRAPAHARLFKEMLLISSLPFPTTAKGTVRRGIVLNEHADAIEQIYAKAEASVGKENVPSEWTLEGVTMWLSKIVGGILSRPVGVDDDLFENGCDRFVPILSFSPSPS